MKKGSVEQEMLKAAVEGNTALVQKCIQVGGGNPDAVLIYAALGYCKNGKEVARVLLEGGANPNICDNKDLTPLHEAAFIGNTEVVAVLLKHKANVNARSENGTTPLHSSVYGALRGNAGSIETIRLLLRNGADRTLLGVTRKTAEEEAEAKAENYPEVIACFHEDMTEKKGLSAPQPYVPSETTVRHQEKLRAMKPSFGLKK